MDEWGERTVTDYMGHVQDNAELAVRDMLREAAERLASRFGTVPGDPSKVALSAEDKMDDGSVVRLTLAGPDGGRRGV